MSGRRRRGRDGRSGGGNRPPRPAAAGSSSSIRSSSSSTANPQAGTATSQSSHIQSVVPGMDEKFERELIWCIEKLHMGLSDPKARQNHKQAQEANRVLKILQSNTAPLVRKRQVMQMTFGDYRKKMEAEEILYSADMKKMRLKAVEQEKQQKTSSFFKKSSRKAKSVAVIDPNFTLEASDKPFKFGFDIGPSDVDGQNTSPNNQTTGEATTEQPSREGEVSGSEATRDVNKCLSSENCNKNSSASDHNNKNMTKDCHIGELGDSPESDKSKLSNNFFKFTNSDNSFRFSFPDPQQQ